MKQTFCVLSVILLMAIFGMKAQQFSVFKTSDGVKVENHNRTLEKATVGMSLKPTDIMVIPKGGNVWILEKINNKLYKYDLEGSISVVKIKIEAIKNKQDFPLFPPTQGSGEKVSYEPGAVNRDHDVYDPDTLAAYIASRILESESDGMPVVLRYGLTGNGGYSYRLENDLNLFVYFNVLKYKNGVVEISPLGQRSGNYVLPPGHVLQREQVLPLPTDETHVIVVTPFPFDIDSTTQKINSFLQTGTPEARDNTPACVLIFD